MDMSKVNMHKRMAMTGKASDVPAKAGHFRGGGIAKRGRGKALQEGGALVAQMAKQGVGQALQLQEGGVFSDTIGRALKRRTPDAEGRALPRPKKGRIAKRGTGKPRRGKKGPGRRRQGYKAREDESLGMRTGPEGGKKQSMKDRRDESYGKWGSRPNQRINKKHGGRINTRRENVLEEEGRVSAEKAYTSKGKRRLGAEKRRLARELGKKDGGKADKWTKGKFSKETVAAMKKHDFPGGSPHQTVEGKKAALQHASIRADEERKKKKD